ncbi:MAG: hypothetical protein ACE5LV_07845 [Candidatus Aminicenantales bacterium]
MIQRIKRFIISHFEASLLLMIFLGILAIALLVSYKFSFLNFFFLPVILSGYFLGQRRAVLTSFFCILCVILYLIFANLITGAQQSLSLDEWINVMTWGGFLILTGAIIGKISDEREARIRNLQRAYVGALEILLKYMEVADEVKPRSVRVAALAGKMAEAAGLEKRDVENIKSAALLYEAGDLQSSLPFFGEVTQFMASRGRIGGVGLDDRENVMLKSAASLLKEIEPLLSGYHRHYVQEAETLDKELGKIPLGSSLIALADIYDRISHNVPPIQENEAYHSMAGLEALGGRAFPPVAIYALQEVMASS